MFVEINTELVYVCDLDVDGLKKTLSYAGKKYKIFYRDELIFLKSIITRFKISSIQHQFYEDASRYREMEKFIEKYLNTNNVTA